MFSQRPDKRFNLIGPIYTKSVASRISHVHMLRIPVSGWCIIIAKSLTTIYPPYLIKMINAVRCAKLCLIFANLKESGVHTFIPILHILFWDNFVLLCIRLYHIHVLMSYVALLICCNFEMCAFNIISHTAQLLSLVTQKVKYHVKKQIQFWILLKLECFLF